MVGTYECDDFDRYGDVTITDESMRVYFGKFRIFLFEIPFVETRENTAIFGPIPGGIGIARSHATGKYVFIRSGTEGQLITWERHFQPRSNESLPVLREAVPAMPRRLNKINPSTDVTKLSDIKGEWYTFDLNRPYIKFNERSDDSDDSVVDSDICDDDKSWWFTMTVYSISGRDKRYRLISSVDGVFYFAPCWADSYSRYSQFDNPHFNPKSDERIAIVRHKFIVEHLDIVIFSKDQPPKLEDNITPVFRRDFVKRFGDNGGLAFDRKVSISCPHRLKDMFGLIKDPAYRTGKGYVHLPHLRPE
jgi:hypothetical protein